MIRTIYHLQFIGIRTLQLVSGDINGVEKGVILKHKKGENGDKYKPDSEDLILRRGLGPKEARTCRIGAHACGKSGYPQIDPFVTR